LCYQVLEFGLPLLLAPFCRQLGRRPEAPETEPRKGRVGEGHREAAGRVRAEADGAALVAPPRERAGGRS
jgi:hypothetical protein